MVDHYVNFATEWTFFVYSRTGQWVPSYLADGQQYSQAIRQLHKARVDLPAERANTNPKVEDVTCGLCLIYGNPLREAQDITMGHLYYACTVASANKSSAVIVDEIARDALGSARFGIKGMYGPSTDPRYIEGAWPVIDAAEKADCATLATLGKWSVDLLGIPGTELRFVYARHKSWQGIWSTKPGENEKHPTRNSPLLMMFATNMAAGNPNAFEGCLFYQGKWYLGGFGDNEEMRVSSSAEAILRVVTSPNNVDGSLTSGHQAWADQADLYVTYPDMWKVSGQCAWKDQNGRQGFFLDVTINARRGSQVVASTQTRVLSRPSLPDMGGYYALDIPRSGSIVVEPSKEHPTVRIASWDPSSRTYVNLNWDPVGQHYIALIVVPDE